MVDRFQLTSDYQPQGDQPEAIRQLTEGLLRGDRDQVLLGVTGSGKTFTMANVIAQVNRPTLIMSHNKTLAAQLYGEFRGFFPHNAVEYFISYYDYYQPEAYVPTTDTYIAKDASINDEIDRLRLRATSALLERRDVVIVASVSCIYGIGSPDEWRDFIVLVEKGQALERDTLIQRLVDMHYTRNDMDIPRGAFRVRGETVEIHPADEETGLRVEFSGDRVERISDLDLLTRETIAERGRVAVYPAKHFVTSYPRLEGAMRSIRAELVERCVKLRAQGKLLEAQRLEQRTNFDLEMMREIGYCSGIENYSRHISGRKPGERPFCLLDFFPRDFLLVIDESHVSVPQIRGMYAGDRSRKETLVEYGFRLPSALDNRPLRFDEFEGLVTQVIYVSATPADYELHKSGGVVVEQIIRPTGLIDPRIVVRPIQGQIDDLISRIKERLTRNERALVTTLTKRMAEDLADYLVQMGLRVRWMHSEIGALERVEILRGLRLGEFDVLVGINLLREGLDLPEVSLVAILDADKEGFLRSERSLIQIAGRAARHIEGEVVMYADHLTESMQKAIRETERRRQAQRIFNEEHGIAPASIVKSVQDVLRTTSVADARQTVVAEKRERYLAGELDREEMLRLLEREMKEAAKALDFEKASLLRDELLTLRTQEDRTKPKPRARR